MNAELASTGDRPYSSPQRHATDGASLTNTFTMYENPTYGITIQYPSNWEKIEYPRIGLAAVGSDLVVNFAAPVSECFRSLARTSHDTGVEADSSQKTYP